MTGRVKNPDILQTSLKYRPLEIRDGVLLTACLPATPLNIKARGLFGQKQERGERERGGEGDLRAGAAGSASSDLEGGREGGRDWAFRRGLR